MRVTKLVAIIRHEYLKRVRSAGFIISTVLGPLILAAAFIFPVLIAFIQPSAPRIAVLDQSGVIYERFRTAVAEHKGWVTGNSKQERKGGGVSFPAVASESSLPGAPDFGDFKIESIVVCISGRSLEEAKRDLTARVLQDQLDAFLIIPTDVLMSGKVEYYSHSSGDPISNE